MISKSNTVKNKNYIKIKSKLKFEKFKNFVNTLIKKNHTFEYFFKKYKKKFRFLKNLNIRSAHKKYIYIENEKIFGH